MEKNKKSSENLSYESDGKMGKNHNTVKDNKKDQADDFFNTTQNSE
ncbi:hypothetical protein [Neobacillus sp. SuZ13]|nr:hypothetical protein [Neobacillus sp. SuZ13]WHY69778.1 hypothetical protein QNH17_14605 [Neobacillus sp. SuZ13]